MENTDKNDILAAINQISVSIVKLDTKIGIMQKDVAKIPEIEKQVAKIPEIERKVAKIPEIEKQVAKIPEIEKQIVKIPELEKEIRKISEIQEESRKISKSVAVIEHEHGDKLKALFDAFTMNIEKIEMQEKRITLCERKNENYDADIYYLKTKVQGL